MTPERRIPGTSSARDASTNTATTTDAATKCNTQLRRRRAAAQRLPIMSCGNCADPWTCRCREADREPSDLQVDAYRMTAMQLLELGYPPAPDIAVMRAMWRHGGTDQQLARRIAELWEVAA